MIERGSGGGWSERFTGPVRVGDTVSCGPDDAVLAMLDGAVIATLGPGAHVLDPARLPGLSMAQAPDQILRVELWFVRTQPTAGQAFGFPLGSIPDPATGAVATVAAMGRMTLKIADPARYVIAATGMQDADLRAWVQSKLSVALRTQAVPLALQKGVAALSDPAVVSQLAAGLAASVMDDLRSYGVELQQVEELAFSVRGPASPDAGAPPPAEPPAEQVYEMLWDCPHCGTKKNLGLTHRHCPSCGGPQDANWRYFPADHEKVAVQDHEYVGADLECVYCNTFNSRRARHCRGCGAPLEGAKPVRQRQDQLHAGPYAGESIEAARHEFAPAPASPPATKQRRSWLVWAGGVGCLGLVLVAVVVGLLFVFWKRAGALEVAGHSWERQIQIERYGPVSESAWCDQMPAGATQVRREREVRSHREVPDGQDCKTRRIDRGDGTYAEKQECKTRYRKEPVHDDKCYYQIVKWSSGRTERAAGASLDDAPRWPEVELSRTGQCVGCEREGTRSERYVVEFVERGSGEKATCEFDQKRWQGFSVGSKWTGKLSVIGSVLDCSSLKSK